MMSLRKDFLGLICKYCVVKCHFWFVMKIREANESDVTSLGSVRMVGHVLRRVG